jgi:hypothetical protein
MEDIGVHIVVEVGSYVKTMIVHIVMREVSQVIGG